MRTLLVILLILLLSVSTSWSQTNGNFKGIKADSIYERQSGLGLKVKNANLISPTINDSTIDLHIATKAPSASTSIADSLRNFFALESKNGYVKLYGTKDSSNSITSVSTVNDTVLNIIDDALGDGLLKEKLLFIIATYGTGVSFKTPSSRRIEIKGVTFFDNYIDNPGSIVMNFSGSLTDGTPTDAEIDAIVTPVSSGQFVVIKDSDGTQLLYLCGWDGTSWNYTVLTTAL